MTAATYPAAMIRSVRRAVSRAAARRLTVGGVFIGHRNRPPIHFLFTTSDITISRYRSQVYPAFLASSFISGVVILSI